MNKREFDIFQLSNKLRENVEDEFMGPKPPKPQPLPPPPEIADPAVAEARRKEQEAAQRARGRAATILTGGLGVGGSAPVTRPTLLGG